MSDHPFAVIDIGSNSGRILVARLDAHGYVEVLQEATAPLRLVQELGPDGCLRPEAIAYTLRVLADFRAVAMSAGAVTIRAVATAAVREARNGPELAARIQDELGIEVAIIDGEREGYLAFLGAISSLPIEHGLLVDLGGGSIQVLHFRDRRLLRCWTLPLGALRLSGRFLAADPPRPGELQQLATHVRTEVTSAAIPRLEGDEVLVGTGGTIRNLARIARQERRYPIERVHGHELAFHEVRDIAALVAARKARKRAAIAGLSADRVDSIAGGALTVQTLMELVGADRLVVSGKGLREGLAHVEHGDEPPAPEVMRHASLAALTHRFSTWSEATASRRATIAAALLTALRPNASPEEREILRHAAQVLDVGRGVDYYRRYHHAAASIAAADLSGFSHRTIALLVATVDGLDQKRIRVKRYRPLLTDRDEPPLRRLSTILALAEEIERRCPPGDDPGVRCQVDGDDLVCTAPIPADPPLDELRRRFRRATGYRVRFELERSTR